jgi:hypothetical protein
MERELPFSPILFAFLCCMFSTDDFLYQVWSLIALHHAYDRAYLSPSLHKIHTAVLLALKRISNHGQRRSTQPHLDSRANIHQP